MKKFLLLSMIVLSGAIAAHAAPTAAERPEYVTRIESCEAILREFMHNPNTAIPAEVLKSAQGIVIVNQFKAGFFVGVKDGYATIMVRKPDGKWSLPVLLNAGELSVGLQFGANAVETVMILNDPQTPRMLFNRRFNVGADAKAVAGPRAAEREKFNHEMLRTPVLVYSKAKGLYAGATVKAGWLQRNDGVNFILYNTQYTLPELLYSDWVQPVPEVVPLMEYVQQIAQ
jgi:lipid-binding SYLF domain-containing protein